jgi:hypothetical protein
MPGVDLSEVLQIVSLFGAIFLVTKLLHTGLWRSYPIFFWYLIFRIPNTFWPLVIPNRTSLYEHIWLSTEPIAWVFHVLVVVELCRLVLNRHRGIYSLLRWAMYASVVLAVTISILSLLPKISHAKENSRLVGIYFASQRGIDLSLAILIILILFFLSRYPVRLNRNILVHSTLYTIFFFGGAFTMLMHTLFGRSNKETANMNLILEAISAACVFSWAIFLTRKGEELPASFLSFTHEHEQRALRQLETLNATLLKVSGK